MSDHHREPGPASETPCMQLVFHDEPHQAHNPKMCFYRGVAQQSREVAERATILNAA